LITGVSYVITFVGNTDFTLIGASSNTVGTVFLYNGGVQSGTGTVTLSNPIWAISGETVKINGVGNPAYNGTVTIASSDQYSFSYYNPSLSNESSTSDTGGTVGACFGDVYVTGYLF